MKSSNEILKGVFVLGIGLFVMYVIRALCRYYVSCQGHVMGANMESDMRQDLFNQYQRLSFSYYDKHNTGVMMSRVVSDLFDICEFAHHGPEKPIYFIIQNCRIFHYFGYDLLAIGINSFGSDCCDDGV